MRFEALPLLALAGACTGGTPPGSSSTPVGSSAAPVEVVDEVEQVRYAATDVLLVVDPEAAAPGLADEAVQNLPMALDYGLGTGTSWHVGLLGTGLGDPAELGVVHWIDLSTPNPLAQLGGLVVDGDGPFGALGALQAALDGGADPGFLQDGAPLHVVVVAGADDATPGLTAEDFAVWLGGLGRDVHWTVFAPAGSTAYETVAASFPGLVADPAVDSLAAVLDEVGLAASGLTRTFPLSDEPVPGTIAVEVETPDGVLLQFVEGADWTYDGPTKAVTFTEYVPSWGHVVRIRYSAL